MVFLKLCLIFFLGSAHAYEFFEQFHLKVGGGVGVTQITTLTKETVPAVGFNTLFGYRFKNVELNLASYVNLAKLRKSSHRIFSYEFDQAKGTFRSVSFGPQWRYLFNKGARAKDYYWSVAITPLVGLSDHRYSKGRSIQGNRQDFQKVTYEHIGFSLQVGLEEWLPKSERPVFYEISYKYLRSYKAALVGGSTTKVETLQESTNHLKTTEHSLLFLIGLTLF